jgi:hypothetical protein
MYASNKQKTIKTEVLNNGKMFLKKKKKKTMARWKKRGLDPEGLNEL